VTSRFRGSFRAEDDKRGGILSAINGDKSRFHRLRKQKALQRQRNRELRKALGLLKPPAAKAGGRAS
jgi:hypothetical protein